MICIHSECFEEYEASISELAKAMVGVMCEGLGIASDHFDQYRKTNDCLIRLNYYTPCPEPSDPNILTLLHQGNTGGLQVMKDGQWIAVRPLSNAFVVNVGDCLEVLCKLCQLFL
jgi:isopenicillin N synthase-like dioxygenase